MGNWFLLQTKSRQENRAVENLERQGVDSFCPMIRVEKSFSWQKSGKASHFSPAIFLSILTRTRCRQPLFDQPEVSATLLPAQVHQSMVPDTLIEQLQKRTAPGSEERLQSAQDG